MPRGKSAVAGGGTAKRGYATVGEDLGTSPSRSSVSEVAALTEAAGRESTDESDIAAEMVVIGSAGAPRRAVAARLACCRAQQLKRLALPAAALVGLVLAFATGTASCSSRAVCAGTTSEVVGPGRGPEDWAELPAAGAQLDRLVYGSCAHQQFPQPFWDTVWRLQPALFIFGGDNVYGDCSAPACAELAAAYQALADHPSFRGVRPALPIVAAIDDHDAGQNDAGGDNPFKLEAKRMFLDFFRPPADDPRRHRPGLYTAYVFGPPGRRTQVLLLDTRSFRSPLRQDAEGNNLPSLDPEATMLGEDQWAWLAAELQRPAELRLLCSSVQVLADGHPYEKWRNFPAELARLFQLLADVRADGVILLSGDRHVGGLYAYGAAPEPAGSVVLPAGALPPYSLHEMTSSALTHTSACSSEFPALCEEPGANRLGELVRVNNIGVVDVDWPAREVRLRLVRAEQTQGRGSSAGNADAGKSLPGQEVVIPLDSLAA
jgi:alkaline phosphatase D